MADPADDRIVERYRALGRAEPPAELDATILAAARRAASSRPGRRRWMLPVSIAAVVVLSVSVALQVQRERPGTADRLGAPPAAGKAVAPAAPAAESNRVEAPAQAAAPAARMLQKSDQASPEAWLARIAKLRREGRDEEADRQLKEFRRRFPDYRIPPAIQREVEPR
jgi:hypothetical protein